MTTQLNTQFAPSVYTRPIELETQQAQKNIVCEQKQQFQIQNDQKQKLFSSPKKDLDVATNQKVVWNQPSTSPALALLNFFDEHGIKQPLENGLKTPKLAKFEIKAISKISQSSFSSSNIDAFQDISVDKKQIKKQELTQEELKKEEQKIKQEMKDHQELFYTWSRMKKMDVIKVFFPLQIDSGSLTSEQVQKERYRYQDVLKQVNIDCPINMQCIECKSHVSMLSPEESSTQKCQYGLRSWIRSLNAHFEKKCFKQVSEMDKTIPHSKIYRCDYCHYQTCDICLRANIFINGVLNRED